MANLRFMSKQDTGGWSVEASAQRRELLQKMHDNGVGLNAVVQLKTGEYAGIAGFREISWWNRSAEMGIILHPDFWSRGLATEIHYLCLQWAFEVLQLNRIEFRTSAENAGMIYLCKEVMHATHEGTLRGYFPHSDYSAFRVPIPEDGSAATADTHYPMEAASVAPTMCDEVKALKYQDVVVYSVLAPEWPRAKESLLARMNKASKSPK